MVINNYNSIIRENFDLRDPKTRRAIVALEANQKDNQVVAALASALYDKIVEKADKIDFGTIPKSRGDITKVDGFEKTMECLRIMRSLVIEYKENPKVVDIVLSAVENIRSRKGLFSKAFNLGVHFPMMLYNIIVLAIEQSTSYLITVCIEYIKDPTTDTFKAALIKSAYNNSEKHLLLEQLVSFNKICSSRELDKILESNLSTGVRGVSEDYTITCAPGTVLTITAVKDNPANPVQNNTESPFEPYEDEAPSNVVPEDDDPAIDPEPEDDTTDEVPALPSECGDDSTECRRFLVDELDEDDDPVEEVPADDNIVDPNNTVQQEFGIGTAATIVFVATTGIFAVVKVIIPIIRNSVYYFYKVRTDISTWMEVQAKFIELNAMNLAQSDSTIKDKDKVVEKQLKVVSFLHKIANTFAIDKNNAEKFARTESEKDSKEKVKIDDVSGKMSEQDISDIDLF